MIAAVVLVAIVVGTAVVGTALGETVLELLAGFVDDGAVVRSAVELHAAQTTKTTKHSLAIRIDTNLPGTPATVPATAVVVM